MWFDEFTSKERPQLKGHKLFEVILTFASFGKSHKSSNETQSSLVLCYRGNAKTFPVSRTTVERVRGVGWCGVWCGVGCDGSGGVSSSSKLFSPEISPPKYPG